MFDVNSSIKGLVRSTHHETCVLVTSERKNNDVPLVFPSLDLNLPSLDPVCLHHRQQVPSLLQRPLRQSSLPCHVTLER